jgi:hypothetical protein
MGNVTSGRFSRYPAVNRSVSKPTSKNTTATTDTSSMTVDEVIAWVGDDASRRAEALATEQAGKNRKSLLGALAK